MLLTFGLNIYRTWSSWAPVVSLSKKLYPLLSIDWSQKRIRAWFNNQTKINWRSNGRLTCQKSKLPPLFNTVKCIAFFDMIAYIHEFILCFFSFFFLNDKHILHIIFKWWSCYDKTDTMVYNAVSPSDPCRC